MSDRNEIADRVQAEGEPAEGSEVLGLLVEWMRLAGAPLPLTSVDGAWVGSVNPVWSVFVNGHARPVRAGPHVVPPRCAYVELRGLPAGLLDLVGCEGQFVCSPAANLSHFTEALRLAIRRLGGSS